MLLRISKPNLAVVIKRNFTQGLTDASIFSILSPTFERSSLKKFGVGQGSQSLRLNKTKKKQKHQMHHRKSTSDGSQRSPGAPGGSPNLPFLRAYARTARNSEVVISFESSTLGKGKGVQVKKGGKQLSALAFDPSVPCTFSRGMYYCLQTKLGWNQPTS
jgi:hypothetical protein